MRVAVAGGTGLVGAMVVAGATAQGHEAVALSRAAGVDLLSGDGVGPALAGCDVVVDCANVATLRRSAAVDFFTRTTRTLLAAEAKAGVRHHVVLSIVGIDRVDSGYYAGKLAQEKAVEGGQTPWTILRATQFHEFATQVLTRVPPGPVALVPRLRAATVAASEVASELLRLAGQPPQGMARELAGPEVHELPDLVRRLLRSEGRRRWVLPLPALGRSAAAQAHGAMLPTGDPLRGRQTYDQWLAARTAQPGTTTRG